MFRKMAEFLASCGVPKDVVLGELLVSFVGRHCLVIENYRTLLLCEENEIRVQAKNCRLIVRGKRLGIVYYDKEQMKICGAIQSTEFE
ncbi:MAG: YabP/YqfC family sporulation protein [bacterium]|nr:YabP/YqfC family sporulation protein [bacterium]